MQELEDLGVLVPQLFRDAVVDVRDARSKHRLHVPSGSGENTICKSPTTTPSQCLNDLTGLDVVPETLLDRTSDSCFVSLLYRGEPLRKRSGVDGSACKWFCKDCEYRCRREATKWDFNGECRNDTFLFLVLRDICDFLDFDECLFPCLLYVL